MNQLERLLAVLKLEKVDRIPCACPLQTGTEDLMKATGAYWPEANDDPELMAKLALAAHTVAGIESVRVPFDVSVDATAFGALTGKATRLTQPMRLDQPFSNPDNIESADVPDPKKDGRAPVVLEAVKILKETVKDEVPVIAAITSTFMVTCQLRGEELALVDIIKRPDTLEAALRLACEWNIAFSEELIDAGADVITLVDATSSGDVLGPKQYERFAMPYQKKIAAAVRRKGTPTVLHICGNTLKNLPYMAATGVNGISVEQSMDLKQVKKIISGKAALVGNVDPTRTLVREKPEDVEAEVKRAIEDGTDILAPGCGFSPETPLANMKAMVEATKRYGVY